MSQGYPSPPSPNFQRPSTSEPSPYRKDRSNTPRNQHGKRFHEDLQDDQGEAPRKIARLDGSHCSEREESRQPSNLITINSKPEREQEFVDGPGHIIFVEEQGKQCPAFCFNKGLFSRFAHIAATSRELREKGREIQEAELELERIKSSNQSAGLEEARVIVEEALKNQEEVEAEIPELVEARRRYDSLVRENKWSTLLHDNSKDIARYVIEDILDRANLLKIPTSKPQWSIEVKESHSANPAPVPEKTVHGTGTSNVPERSPASSTTILQRPMDNEEHFTPRQLALRHLRFAEEDLVDRMGHFVFMQEGYAQGIAAERRYQQEQYPDRPASITQTDIDLKCLRKKQKATRKVIEAEEAYDRAEQDAEALGLGDILADPDACYSGEIHNEFAPRTPKSSPMFPVDGPRIETWMASIPDSAVVGPQRLEVAESTKVDEWEAKPVEVFDSISVIAHDMYRKKIDKWQELSGHLRQAEAEGPLPRTVRRNPWRRCRGR